MDDEALRQLAREAEPALAHLLRRAYELGYREALAARPAMAYTAPTPPIDTQGAPDPTTPGELDANDIETDRAPSRDDIGDDPFMPSERSGLFDFSGLGAVDSAPTSEPGATSPQDASNPLQAMLPLIRKSARIGTLVGRIRHYFGLERFDIDIVVCRKGDPNRRQLRSDVRLSKYAVG